VRGWHLTAGSERSVAGEERELGWGAAASNQATQLDPAHFRAGRVYHHGPNGGVFALIFRRVFQ